MFNKNPKEKRLNILKKQISKRAEIQKKAVLVLSNFPPNPDYSSIFRAKYIRPNQKISLPPLKIKLRVNTESDSISPINSRINKYIEKKLEVLKGVPKFLTTRVQSKSLEVKYIHKKSHSSFVDYPQDTRLNGSNLFENKTNRTLVLFD